MAREKMSDVIEQRDALRRRTEVLEHVIQAQVKCERSTFESIQCTDDSYGAMIVTATAYRVERSHGGVVVVEHHYIASGIARHDVSTHYLEEWAYYYGRDGLTHGALYYAEQTLAERITKHARALQSAA
jgi:hypothetical protein